MQENWAQHLFLALDAEFSLVNILVFDRVKKVCNIHFSRCLWILLQLTSSFCIEYRKIGCPHPSFSVHGCEHPLPLLSMETQWALPSVFLHLLHATYCVQCDLFWFQKFASICSSWKALSYLLYHTMFHRLNKLPIFCTHIKTGRPKRLQSSMSQFYLSTFCHSRCYSTFFFHLCPRSQHNSICIYMQRIPQNLPPLFMFPCLLFWLHTIPGTPWKPSFTALLFDGSTFTAKITICNLIDKIVLVESLISKCFFIAFFTCHVLLLPVYQSWWYHRPKPPKADCFCHLCTYLSDLHIFISLTHRELSIHNIEYRIYVGN